MRREGSYQEHGGGDGGADVGPAGGVPHDALHEAEVGGEKGVVLAEEDLHAALAPARLLHEGVADRLGHLPDGQILLHVRPLPPLLLHLQSQGHVLAQRVGGEPPGLQWTHRSEP